jgi:hypothetical protein
VIGATGHQGGGVVRALHADGRFKARDLTRGPGKHRDLADEVVAADLDHPPASPILLTRKPQWLCYPRLSAGFGLDSGSNLMSVLGLKLPQADSPLPARTRMCVRPNCHFVLGD